MKKKSIDITYVERLQNKDESAFIHIYDFYKNTLYYFALTLTKNTADAEEVVQDTFVQVLKRIDTLRKPSSFHSWIFSITYNNAMHVHRSKTKTVQPANDYIMENTIATQDTPAELLRKKDFLEIVEQEIEQMPDYFTSVAQLKYFDQLTSKEIATILNISEGTVKTRLIKIRSNLQKKLSNAGYSGHTQLSLVGLPFVTSAFANLIQKSQMSTEASVQMYDNILVKGGTIATSGMMGKAILTMKGMSLTLKACIAISIISIVGIAGVYQASTTTNIQIQEVVYPAALTNENLHVEVSFNQSIRGEDVEITYNQQVVAHKAEDNVLSFIVVENGTYLIKTIEEEKMITIDNLDKQAPQINGIAFDEEGLTFSMEDVGAGVDYKNTYFEYEGKSFNITANGKVSGTYVGTLLIHVVDLAGNSSTYSYVIEEAQIEVE